MHAVLALRLGHARNVIALNRFQTLLPQRTVALLNSTVSRRYLTGFSSSEGLLLVARERVLFLADSRYIEQARRMVTCCEVEELVSSSDQVRVFCKETRSKIVLIETQQETAKKVKFWQESLPGLSVHWRNPLLDRVLQRLRGEKTSAEVECLVRAQRIAERAFEMVCPEVRPGRSERELSLLLDEAVMREGAEALSFPTIVAAGACASMPHAVPGDTVFQSGDMVVFDFGAVHQGYHSDMTRTVFVGEMSPTNMEIYGIVRAAQEAALLVAGPGVRCKTVDAAARDLIAAAGYGDFFRHATGHGVGLEIHEFPSISEKSKETLTPGMVVTIEPGIYLPGQCGVRIEDMILITESGNKNLTKAAK